MSEKHGAEKEVQADHLYQVVYRTLVAHGLDPRYRVQLVIDGKHFDGGQAIFGAVPTDRLEQMVRDATAKHRDMQQDAVGVLSKFTLSKEIKHKLNGSNHNG